MLLLKCVRHLQGFIINQRMKLSRFLWLGHVLPMLSNRLTYRASLSGVQKATWRSTDDAAACSKEMHSELR